MTDAVAIQVRATADEGEEDAVDAVDVDPAQGSRPPTAGIVTQKSVRSSLYEALARPVGSFASRLGPLRVSRASTYIVERAASFHKKALKGNTTKPAKVSHLKLGRMRGSDISMLYRNIHIAILLPSVTQTIYTILSPSWSLLPNTGVLAGVLAVTSLYIRRIALYQDREGIQLELLRLACMIWVIAALLLAGILCAHFQGQTRLSQQLLASANTLLAALLYGILSHFSDYYTQLTMTFADITAEDERRKLRRTRRINALFMPAIVIYTAFRAMVSWRNNSVLDFLPMTNVITVARVLLAGQTIQQQYLLYDTIAISAGDALLLSAVLLKTWWAKNTFRHVFVRDFARIFTEFFVIVLHFRDTLVMITICGHFVCWFAHERLLSLDDIAQIENLGAVQIHFGFLLSLLVWLTITLFCALPLDAEGVSGWIVPSSVSDSNCRTQHFRYFLFASDVHIMATFTDLALIEQINPFHFVMEKQIEAFNLAQLVYSCGKKPDTDPAVTPPDHVSDANSGNDVSKCERIQEFVKDTAFTVVAVIENASTDTHCIVLQSPSLIAVAFRGTSSKKNAHTDLKAAMTTHRTAKSVDLSTLVMRISQPRVAELVVPNVTGSRTLWHRLCCKRNSPKVHSGFYGAYLSVEQRVLAAIAELHRQDPRNILITGHSLGGALAVLCSFDVATRLGFSNVTCTTFGCPRMSNTAFRKRHMLAVPATFAVINAADVVTKLPPKTPKALSYVNVGHVALINSLGNLVLDPSVLELAVLHHGLSAKAHALNAYQLSLLLWCLRAHGGQFQPHFWRPAQSFLQAASGQAPELRTYLAALKKTSTVATLTTPDLHR